MRQIDLPAFKFPVGFASGAPAGDVTYPIPTAQPGAPAGLAGLASGFTHINFTPIAAGGIPPWGKDINGILLMATLWLQWMQAGLMIPYDATFQTAIGGYPKAALIESATGPGLAWVSTADNNLTNPDAAGAGWAPSVQLMSSNRAAAGVSTMYTYPGNPNTHLPGTASVVGVSPPDTCWDITDAVMYVCTVSGNAATAVWVALNPPATPVPPPPQISAPFGGLAFYVNGNFVVPDNVYTFKYRFWAGGGGGGGAPNDGSGILGCGGGAGGYCEGFYNAQPGNTFAVIVGAGGAFGNLTGNGSPGGQSLLNGPGVTAAAFGGAGGPAGSNGPAAGGTATGANIFDVPGGPGVANWLPASSFSTPSSYPPLYGPQNGVFPGGGGSGANPAFAFSGGAGANGVVIVEW